MSKLQSKLAKSGIELSAQATKSKTSKLPVLQAPKDVKAAVDGYLAALEAEKEASARKATAASELQGFYLGHVYDKKDTDSVILEGGNGAVNVTFKSQYSMKTPEVLREVMGKQGLDWSQYVTEQTSVVINYDALTDAEINKLVSLIKSFGQDRVNMLIQEKTTYKVNESFTKEMTKAKTREEFDLLREASGHFTPTVAARKS